MKLLITKETILNLLEVELSFLRRVYNVSKIGLFGSYARNEEKVGSDVDLLVEFEKPISFFRLFQLEEYLSDKLGTRVEIVTPDAIKKLVAPTIMGDVIYVE